MIDDRELSDYLLGELEPDARRRMDRRLAEDSELRARVESLSPVVNRLQTLSPAAWEAINGDDAELSGPDEGEPAPQAVRAGRRLRRVSPRVAVALAGAAIVLFAAGIGVGALLEREPDTSGAVVALKPLPGGLTSASGTAQVSAGQRLDLKVSDLPRNATGTYYEAWLMTSTTKLVAIASFTVDSHGGAHMQVTLPAPARSYRFIDISRQLLKAGTAHSGDSVLRGPT